MSSIRLAIDNTESARDREPDAPAEARLPLAVCLGLWIVAALVIWALAALAIRFI